MRPRWSFIAPFLVLGAAYLSYPYVTLYRLGAAMKTADATTLEKLVDWASVREGIKEDVCDLGMDAPSGKGGGTLPPFGASFVRGIASSAIDQVVTPQALVAAVSLRPADQPAAPAGHGMDVHVDWAFFDAPTAFLVSLKAAGQSSPIKLELDLHDGAWRVQRVWLPPEMLSNRSRT